MKRIKRTLLTASCVLAALLWLGAPTPARAWTFAPEDGKNQSFGTQRDDASSSAPLSSPDTRDSGGMLAQLLPVVVLVGLGWLFFRGFSRRGRGPLDGPRDSENSREFRKPRPPARRDDADDSGASSGPDRYRHDDDPAELQEAYRRARAQWEWLTADPSTRKAGDRDGRSPAPAPDPGGFDRSEFLRGAKLAYARLTEAFDTLDADAAEPFAAPEVLDGLKARAASGAQPTSTEIVLVDAELLEHVEHEDREEAVVLYDALVRRGPDAAEPEQLKQVWRFARDPRVSGSTWRLARMEPYHDPAAS